MTKYNKTIKQHLIYHHPPTTINVAVGYCILAVVFGLASFEVVSGNSQAAAIYSQPQEAASQVIAQ